MSKDGSNELKVDRKNAIKRERERGERERGEREGRERGREIENEKNKVEK